MSDSLKSPITETKKDEELSTVQRLVEIFRKVVLIKQLPMEGSKVEKIEKIYTDREKSSLKELCLFYLKNQPNLEKLLLILATELAKQEKICKEYFCLSLQSLGPLAIQMNAVEAVYKGFKRNTSENLKEKLLLKHSLIYLGELHPSQIVSQGRDSSFSAVSLFDEDNSPLIHKKAKRIVEEERKLKQQKQQQSSNSLNATDCSDDDISSLLNQFDLLVAIFAREWSFLSDKPRFTNLGREFSSFRKKLSERLDNKKK